MDINELEVVCELVNYKNFADAAFSLAYSPSVITKYVSNVEKEPKLEGRQMIMFLAPLKKKP